MSKWFWAIIQRSNNTQYQRLYANMKKKYIKQNLLYVNCLKSENFQIDRIFGRFKNAIIIDDISATERSTEYKPISTSSPIIKALLPWSTLCGRLRLFFTINLQDTYGHMSFLRHKVVMTYFLCYANARVKITLYLLFRTSAWPRKKHVEVVILLPKAFTEWVLIFFLTP